MQQQKYVDIEHTILHDDRQCDLMKYSRVLQHEAWLANHSLQPTFQEFRICYIKHGKFRCHESL